MGGGAGTTDTLSWRLLVIWNGWRGKGGYGDLVASNCASRGGWVRLWSLLGGSGAAKAQREIGEVGGGS